MATTLKEFKEKVLSFIEEHDKNSSSLTNDKDIADKINLVINAKLFEIARYKKIYGTETLNVNEDEEVEMTDIDKDIYQINKITGVRFEIIGNTIIFLDTGTAKVYYSKYPKSITIDTNDDNYKFEIDTEALEIMTYGVAADLLKADVSNQYGRIWDNEYQRLLQTLDPRKNAGTIYIGKGVDI